jgi:hypothetical protein
MGWGFGLAALAAVQLATPPAPTPAPDLSGAWMMGRITNDNGCREWWILDHDGTGRIQSGQEVSEISWRVEAVEGGHDLVYRSRPPGLTARPDCNARAWPDTSSDGVRRAVRIVNANRFEFCGQAWEDETIQRRDRCWAALERQDTAAWTGDTADVEDVSARFVAAYRYEAIHASLRERSGCRTVWTLDPDSMMTVASGASVVRARWRVAIDAGQYWLTIRDAVGNGQPDCTGVVTPPGLPPYRQHIVVLRNGTFVATLPPVVGPGGVTQITGPTYRLVRDPPLVPAD